MADIPENHEMISLHYSRTKQMPQDNSQSLKSLIAIALYL